MKKLLDRVSKVETQLESRRSRVEAFVACLRPDGRYECTATLKRGPKRFILEDEASLTAYLERNAIKVAIIDDLEIEL